MITFRSCHLIVNRTLPDDHRRVCDFIDNNSFRWGGISIYFLNGLHPQTLTFVLAITLIFENR